MNGEGRLSPPLLLVRVQPPAISFPRRSVSLGPAETLHQRLLGQRQSDRTASATRPRRSPPAARCRCASPPHGEFAQAGARPPLVDRPRRARSRDPVRPPQSQCRPHDVTVNGPYGSTRQPCATASPRSSASCTRRSTQPSAEIGQKRSWVTWPIDLGLVVHTVRGGGGRDCGRVRCWERDLAHGTSASPAKGGDGVVAVPPCSVVPVESHRPGPLSPPRRARKTVPRLVLNESYFGGMFWLRRKKFVGS